MKKMFQRMNKSTAIQNRKKQGFVVFCFFTVVFAICVIRFFYIAINQHANGVYLPSRVAQLYGTTKTINAKRGTIYDASNQAIAEDTTTYNVYIVLSHKAKSASGKRLYLAQSDKPKAAKLLANVLGGSYQTIYQQLNPTNSNTYQVELGSIGKNLSFETKNKIEQAHITGINFTPSTSRLYPNGTFASNIVGVLGYDKTTKKNQGVMGIELAYNKLLTGTNGSQSSATDSNGVQITRYKSQNKAAVNGDDVYTTLDSHTQNYLETLMSSVQKKYSPKSLVAVIMNAKTGEIIAASQRPTFNPETLSGLSGSSWTNLLTESSFEPGSVMKVFSMAAAIDSGNYNSKATYTSGTYKIGTSTVYDWNRSGWGQLTYRQGFIRSSNVAMAHLERLMGKNTWYSYIKQFGFLKTTNTGMGAESSGSISYTYPIDQANTAYGQGIDVTVMQLMQGYTAIANGGKLVQPRIIKKIVNPNTNKVVYQSKTTTLGNPIKASTAKTVLSMMQDVVYNENGTGNAYKISGYKIAAKTGTAQIASPTGSGYLIGDTNYVFSVVGMAPASNPKYIMFVAMKQPKTLGASQSASKILAQIFNPIMKRVLDEDSTTTSQSAATTVTLNNYRGQSVASVKAQLIKQGLDVTVIGSGKTVNAQSLAAGQSVLAGTRIILTTSGTASMPDINGWSRSEVSQLASLLNLNLKTSGSGYVTSQSIAPNAQIKAHQTLSVTLKN